MNKPSKNLKDDLMFKTVKIIFLIVFLFSCRTLQQKQSSSVLDDTLEIRVETIQLKPTAQQLDDILDLQELNNRRWDRKSLEKAFIPVTGESNSGNLRALLFYNTSGELQGQVLYQELTDQGIILIHDAITFQYADEKMEQVLKNKMEQTFKETIKKYSTIIKKPVGAVSRIERGFTDHISTLKNLRFAEAPKVGDSLQGAAQNEAGDQNWLQKVFFIWGEVSPQTLSSIADKFPSLSTLDYQEVLSDNPELRAERSLALVDLRKLFIKRPSLYKDIETINLDMTYKIVRTINARRSYISIGEKGDGKTYNVIRTLALIAREDPRFADILKNSLGSDFILEELRLENLLAGTSYRGQLEKRLKSILSENRVAILFSDEIHQLTKMDPDVLDLLKTAMGEKKVILVGTTTVAEFYEKFFGKTAFLDRTFIDQFLPLSEEEIVALIKYKIKSNKNFSDIKNLDLIAQKIYNYTEKFDPNGGRVRSKMDDFIPQLISFSQLPGPNKGPNKITPELIDEFAKVYYMRGFEVILSQDQLELNVLEQFSRNFSSDPRRQEDIQKQILLSIPDFNDGSSSKIKNITLISGPEGSGRSFYSESLAKVLHRPRFEIDLTLITSIEQLNQEIARRVLDRTKPGAFSIIAFKNFSKASPIMQDTIMAIFSKGEFMGSPGKNSEGLQNIRIPNVLCHLLVSSEEKDLFQEIPNRVQLESRSQEIKQKQFNLELDSLLQLNKLKMLDEVKEKFLADFLEKNKDVENYETLRSKLIAELKFWALKNGGCLNLKSELHRGE